MTDQGPPLSSDNRMDVEALDRYLSGEASADERATIDRWVERHSHTLGAPQRPAWNTDDAWTMVAKQTIESRTSRRTASPKRTHGLRSLIGIVAALIVVALSSVGIHFKNGPAHAWNDHVYTTAAGQVASFDLPDGSRMVLAPLSRLRVPGAFGTTTRDVELVGQALFTVESAHRTPFTVRTGAVTTRVLGTVFSVRRYHDDAFAHVTVMTGKVLVGGRQQIAMSAGESAHVSDSTVTSLTRGDTAGAFAWTTGRLDFVDTPAREVFDAVGHWYGVQFRWADSALINEPVSVRFDGQSRHVVLAALQGLLDVSLTSNGSLITISRASKHASPTRRSLSHSLSSSEVGR